MLRVLSRALKWTTCTWKSMEMFLEGVHKHKNTALSKEKLKLVNSQWNLLNKGVLRE
jgi:hypothetical protein